MSKKRKRKGGLIIAGVLLLCAIGLYFFLFNTESQKMKVVDEIRDYGYSLKDRDTELMKNLYDDLKDVLNKSDIDYSKYADIIAKMFIVDVYTMSNKLSKYDVGGVDYIYPDHQENFSLKVEDTLYKYLEEKSSRNNADLPIVKSIESSEVTTGEFVYKDKTYDSYKVSLNWEYEEDFGYDNQGSITLIKVDKKLYIAEYNTEVSL